MRFNVEQFLINHNIPYITRGVNVKRGEWNISCPLCNASGNPDPSYHCGIDPVNLQWSCWRNSKHRGKTLHYLIKVLLNCTSQEAEKILGVGEVWVNEDSWSQLNIGNLFGDKPEPVSKVLTVPASFKRFNGNVAQLPYELYLESRGFPVALDVILAYNLRYADKVPYDKDTIWYRFEKRIIIPLFYEGRLVSFTARSIIRDENLRYYSLSEKDGAVMSLKDIVFNIDVLKEEEGQVLFICEGPFDAIKVDFFGKELGGRATCLFSKSMTQAQLWTIAELAAYFRKMVILLDANEVGDSLNLYNKLSFLKNQLILGKLPENVKDPGDLTQEQVKNLVQKYL